MQNMSDLALNYARQGFVVVRDAIPANHLRMLESQFLSLVEARGGRQFTSIDDTELAAFLGTNRELERTLYDEIRRYPWLVDFSKHESVACLVRELLGAEIGLMEKIPFRIDVPHVTRELAVWHQDFFYVRGNVDVVTAWIPMQDTPYERGCLMVMPGSHQLGALPHSASALGKRRYPSGIFERDVRYVEMNRGDVLLFSALMLHSSGVNISNGLRCSAQARFSRLSDPVDPSMGRLIELPSGVQ
jgi:ectoine hydroxylase-related dioxygenase (phytanoyl-CoA dioxygenase family)